MQISIVVPTLNEEESLVATLASAREPGVREIIVVDGGSTDRTPELAAQHADRVLAARIGRAHQMNAGAAVAAGEVLIFLHADTLLPKGFSDAVSKVLADRMVVGGRFDVSLVPASPLLWLTATLLNLRSRLTRISTGDQAMFVRREVFERLGGFPPILLMEDVEFSRGLKRVGQVACLRQHVTTSSRRWRQDGVVRTVLLMWSLRVLYFCGVSPERLHRFYRNTR